MKPEQDLKAKVERLRERLAEMAADRADLTTATNTTDEAAASLQPWIEAAHAEGAELFRQAALNAATGTPGNALDGFRLQTINGVVDLAPLLAVLLGVDKLRDLIVSRHPNPDALDAKARAQRLSTLAPAMLKLEREEEALIRESEQPGRGPAIPRRPDANPAVVLTGDL